jgi:hypothetical protein
MINLSKLSLFTKGEKIACKKYEKYGVYYLVSKREKGRFLTGFSPSGRPLWTYSPVHASGTDDESYLSILKTYLEEHYPEEGEYSIIELVVSNTKEFTFGRVVK